MQTRSPLFAIRILDLNEPLCFVCTILLAGSGMQSKFKFAPKDVKFVLLLFPFDARSVGMPALLPAAENGCSVRCGSDHNQAGPLCCAAPLVPTSGAVALKFLMAAEGFRFPTLKLNFLVKMLSGVFGCSR